jgi:hypothetical protein
MLRKRPLVKFLILKLKLTKFISRLEDVCLEIAADETDQFEAAQIARNLLSRLQIYDSEEIRFRRYGNPGDGGYVVVDDLMPTDKLLSVGVGSDVSFELEVSGSLGDIHLYDHTVDSLPIDIEGSRFFKFGIGTKNSESFRTIVDALSKFENPGDYILKMDIESCEWSVLLESKDLELKHFRQIIVELHGLDGISKEADRSVIFAVLDRLNKHHLPVHIHPNNYEKNFIFGGFSLPRVIEVTYLRRDSTTLFELSGPRGQHLDFPNNPEIPDVPFPRYII